MALVRTGTENPSCTPVSSLANLLIHAQQLDIENKCGVGRDRTRITFLAVREIGRNAQLPLAADLHSSNTFLPAFDHLMRADTELECGAAHRAVEFFSVGQPS